ncbi:MAG: hypothetical protein ACJ8E3_01635 [Sphingomicrobium sp.]
MSERQAILRQKLEANQRRLKRPVRARALAARGLAVSAIGADQQTTITRDVRTSFEDGEWQKISRDDLVNELRELGRGDTLFVFTDLDDEPGFVVARSAVAEAVAADPATFSPDGFFAVDGEISAALSIDIDEDGSLEMKCAWKIQNA